MWENGVDECFQQNQGALGDCQAEKIARQKAKFENARRMTEEAKRKEVENAQRMVEEAKRKEIENVQHKVKELMRNADRGKMRKWEAEVEKEARAAELVAKAKAEKCKADAAEREVEAGRVVVLEAVSGLEKAVASEVVDDAVNTARKARLNAKRWEEEARRLREG